MNAPAELDIGPLSWVKDEIDLSLDRAGQSLRTHLQAPGDGAPLRAAQNLLHQAQGALAVVGLAGVTEFAQAIEQLLAAIGQQDAASGAAAGTSALQGMEALRLHLNDLIEGRPNRTLSLFPLYREMSAAAGASDALPADLFFPDLSQRPPWREIEPEAPTPEVAQARWKAARLGYQRGMLKWLKNDAAGLREMKNAAAIIESTFNPPAARAPWWIAQAVFDALILEGVPVDAWVKRLGARIDAQIRKLIEGYTSVSERLMRDMLYVVAVSVHSNARIDSVRYAYRLAEQMPAADPEPRREHWRSLREQIAQAMEHWSRFCAGTAAALPPFHECATQLASLGEALARVDLRRLTAAIANLANMLRKDPLANTDAIGEEVATALLLAQDAAADLARQDGQPNAEFAQQVDLTTGRLAALLRGEAPPAMPPSLAGLAQRARLRQARQRAVKEIPADLAQIEQSLDAFFRDPAQNAELPRLALPLARIRDALQAIGQPRALEVLAECAAAIKSFAAPGHAATPEAFEAVARKLSALGILVSRLPGGSTDLDAILAPARQEADAASGVTLEAELAGRTEMTRTLVGALRQTPQDQSLRGELKQNLQALREDAQLVADESLRRRADAAIAALEAAQPAEHIEQALAVPTAPATLPETSEQATRLAGADAGQIDAELLGIFLDEAREVLAAIAKALPRLPAAEPEQALLAALRRAFHTLKGSGRMVGLDDFSETARTVEEAIHRWLQLERAVTPQFLEMIAEARTLFSAWVEALKAGHTQAPDAAALIAQCARLQGEETPAPADAESAAPEPVRVGSLQLEPALYAIYLEDARTHLARLHQELAQCRNQAPGREMLRAAHTLAGASATLGLAPPQELAHALEQALERFAAADTAPKGEALALFERAVPALAQMIESIAGQRMPQADDALGAQLRALLPPGKAATPAAETERRHARLEDDIDPQLLPLFLAESVDLVAAIAAELRAWRGAADNREHAARLRRLLHTWKGSARMAGAMAVGGLAHGLETRIAQLSDESPADTAFFDSLEASFDRATLLIENLRTPRAPPVEDALPADSGAGRAIAWLRVRAEDLDQLVDEGGEIALARSRIEGELRVLRSSLRDMTDNVIRLRNQLREMEIQSDTRIQSQRPVSPAPHEEFDPLEMDRYTRLQELTRMMAESVDDVSTVQHNLLRNLGHADASLAAQSRLNRDLSQRLMNLRLVPLSAIAERLYRVVRQTAKELDKRANLELRAMGTGIDRSLLEKMTGPIEHLLRNAVVHGIEGRAARQAAGKAEQGEIVLSAAQQGGEIVLEISDDGVGLDFAAIRDQAGKRRLLAADQSADEAQLTQFIFLPGFTTVTAVSEISGRGIGMDVVRTETLALGGRIEVNSRSGQGTVFRIALPVTLSITQALLIKSGARAYAIAAGLIDQAREMQPDAMSKVRTEGAMDWQGERYPWHYLPHLLGETDALPQEQPRYWLILVKSGTQRLALEVDALIGNREVVVKDIGPQLARLAGFSGATVLDDGEIALIINPVALAARAPHAAPSPAQPGPAQPAHLPTVLVVDDSITVRKVISRQLERAGYRVLAAKDGLDALERLQETLPDIMLADIEMPRMDGFDLARNIRADARLKHLPIIMITSRSADKHRDYAAAIGVNHYLGKPYDEQELLRLVAGCIARP